MVSKHTSPDAIARSFEGRLTIRRDAHDERALRVVLDGHRQVGVARWDSDRSWWRLVETGAGGQEALIDIYAGPAPGEHANGQRTPDEWAVTSAASRLAQAAAGRRGP